MRDMLGQHSDSVSTGAEPNNDTGSEAPHNGRPAGANGATQQQQPQPLILVTAAASMASQWNLANNDQLRQLLASEGAALSEQISSQSSSHSSAADSWAQRRASEPSSDLPPEASSFVRKELKKEEEEEEEEELSERESDARREVEDGEQVEEIDGIKYRILAAVTKPVGLPARGLLARAASGSSNQREDKSSAHCVIIEQRAEEEAEEKEKEKEKLRPEEAKDGARNEQHQAVANGSLNRRLGAAIRRKSSALVTSLAKSLNSSPEPTGNRPQRRLSILELTKSPPPETRLEVYLNERRRSSSHSAKQVQLEQQTTFETNYSQRQQYFKDLNLKLINHDKKLLNVVANRGQIHRHSVDIAQLPLHLAQAKAASGGSSHQQQTTTGEPVKPLHHNLNHNQTLQLGQNTEYEATRAPLESCQPINQFAPATDNHNSNSNHKQLLADSQSRLGQPQIQPDLRLIARPTMDKRSSISSRGDRGSRRKSRTIIRRFQKLDQTQLNSAPAPDVKIGQRISYKEYYGNEFGTIRWIGRVPQICPDWTAGIEFDNAIGEGDGSLLGRRYFTAKDCFAKFLPLNQVAFVDQHVGRPEPGTMISVMSTAVRPGQMISIQRVSTVHVQNCFLNAPHQVAGADILAVNTRLHCQCPSCGPCAHIIKPPRTQRLNRSKKNATHMCQFSTYTCCGMKSQEEAVCTYKGNKVASLPPPMGSSSLGLPPIGNSWIEGAGYLTNLQAAQSALMPEEYRMGVAPEDRVSKRTSSKFSSRRSSGKQNHQTLFDCPEDTSIAADNITPPQSKSKSPLGCATNSLSPDNITRNNKLLDERNLAIVHRDSIENRYLFPTEEPIDSTLEADLEDLSQARYGRQLYSSRSILKSLRSLVSCLNVRASKSELDKCSEGSLRYSGYAKNSLNNKSTPLNTHETRNSDYGRESEKACYYSGTQSENKITNVGINHVLKGQISSSSDCGFSSGSQNSINFLPKCPTALASEADKEDFISQLASITDEDLSRLKRALYEPQVTTNYFLQNTSVNLMSNGNHDTVQDKHLIAQRLQKLFSTPDFGCEQPCKTPVQGSYCCNNKTDAIPIPTSDDTDAGNKAKAENETRSSTSGSINLSSCDDSLLSTAAISSDPKQHHENMEEQMANDATLRNAFNLELTLSINSDANPLESQAQQQNKRPETTVAL